MNKTIEDKRNIEIDYKTLDEVIKILDNIRKEVGGNARFEISHKWDCHFCYVIWKRPENDKEREERLKQDRENKEWRKKQYEKLKKEFENDKVADSKDS